MTNKTPSPPAQDNDYDLESLANGDVSLEDDVNTKNDQDAEQNADDDGDGTLADGDDSQNDNQQSAPTAQREFLSQFEQTTGRTFPQYASDADFIKAVNNLYSRLGVKDADAQFGKLVRSAVNGREAEFEAFLRQLSGQSQAKPHSAQAAQAQNNDEFDFDPDWRNLIITDENGNLRPAPGAPPDIVDKYHRGQRVMAQRMAEFIKNPTRFIEKYAPDVIEKARQEALQTVQAKTSTLTDEMEVARWREANAQKLYVGGDPANGLTEYGQAVADAYDSLEAYGTFPTQFARLRLAEKIAASSQKPPQNQPARSEAKHTPPIVNPKRAAAASKQTLQAKAIEMIEKEGKDFADVMEWLEKAQAAAKK